MTDLRSRILEIMPEGTGARTAAAYMNTTESVAEAIITGSEVDENVLGSCLENLLSIFGSDDIDPFRVVVEEAELGNQVSTEALMEAGSGHEENLQTPDAVAERVCAASTKPLKYSIEDGVCQFFVHKVPEFDF